MSNLEKLIKILRKTWRENKVSRKEQDEMIDSMLGNDSVHLKFIADHLTSENIMDATFDFRREKIRRAQPQVGVAGLRSDRHG